MFLNWTCDETINSIFIYLQRDYYNFISSFFKFTVFIKFFVFREYLIKYIYISKLGKAFKERRVPLNP